MSDPNPDDEALTWAGDERLEAPVVAERPSVDGGAFVLVLTGILGGVAVIETLGWIRSVTSASIAATLDPGGSAIGTVAFVINLVGRIAAVAAPLLWFAIAAWRIRGVRRRVAWLVLGAVVLVPWPAVLGLL